MVPGPVSPSSVSALPNAWRVMALTPVVETSAGFTLGQLQSFVASPLVEKKEYPSCGF
jgi:hypothetical protein